MPTLDSTTPPGLVKLRVLGLRPLCSIRTRRPRMKLQLHECGKYAQRTSSKEAETLVPSGCSSLLPSVAYVRPNIR